jgi:excisionase family DNA binding protein
MNDLEQYEDDSVPDQLLTVTELAEVLDMSVRRVYELIAEYEIPHQGTKQSVGRTAKTYSLYLLRSEVQKGHDRKAFEGCVA